MAPLSVILTFWVFTSVLMWAVFEQLIHYNIVTKAILCTLQPIQKKLSDPFPLMEKLLLPFQRMTRYSLFLEVIMSFVVDHFVSFIDWCSREWLNVVILRLMDMMNLRYQHCHGNCCHDNYSYLTEGIQDNQLCSSPWQQHVGCREFKWV